MTEHQKSELRALKSSVVADLTARRSHLFSQFAEQIGCDVRLAGYLNSIFDAPDDHNLYEILAVRRFFDFLSRYEWRAKEVLRFFKFYEILKFSGTYKRQSYKLTPIQCFIFANIFGFWTPDGRRVTRDVYLFVPRKFSKTTSVASLAIYDMLYGDANAQAYVGANSYSQAKICFDEIRAVMRDLDPSEKSLRINREKISFRTAGRDSFISCLSANAKTQDGLNASLVIMDEYAQARNTSGRNGADLKNVLTSSMGARRNPLTVVMTTASEVVDGPFAHELEGVKRVLRGEEMNDGVFGALFMPDVDDKEGDPHTWRKVQPHIGVTVMGDYYEKEWLRAQLSTENMMTFRTKMLNVFAINEVQSWISAELASKIMKPVSIESFKRPAAMCAIDLSESGDFSAVSFGIYQPKARNFIFHTAYFFPEGALPGHANETMYRIWAEQGHLHLTEGAVIDYRTIVEYILQANKYLRILQIGYDPWKSQEMINMLAAAGAKNVLKPVRQSYGYFTAPVESFEHGVKTGHVTINDNPINAYCFGNAVLDVDRLENMKPIRRSLNQKIDGVITMLMCMRLFIDFEQ